jgi:outer membrane protein assembly factor BamB
MRQVLLLFLLTICLAPATTHAQPDDACGVLNSINYPIDTNRFQIGQDFGVASERHQGRYHTGEDWFAGRNITRGQTVQAIGRGTVTFSGVRAWGVDGGVVIIRHLLPDGNYIYSVYGHIEQTDSVLLPARLTCVEAGQVIGVVGDARPAPHLHFEMRVFTNQNPGIADNPGPGYTRTDPRLLGYRQPMRMVTNLQARLHSTYTWHSVMASDQREVPPLRLNDNSLLVVDGDRLRRVTNDGRILWRVTVAGQPVSLHGYEAQSFITYSDGRVVQIDVENGGFGDSYTLDFQPDTPPIQAGSIRIYHTRDNQLIAIAPDQREVLWRTPDIPRYDVAFAATAAIGLLVDDELWTISRDGEVLDTAILSNGAAFAENRDGALVAYTSGGLWRIDPQGQWSSLMDIPFPGGNNAGVFVLNDGRIYLTDQEMLYAHSAEGDLLWQARLPIRISGRITMQQAGDTAILLTTNEGHIIAFSDSGGFCSYTRIFGTPRSKAWYDLSPDNTLRASIDDQIMGFDWERFIQGC